MFWNPPDTARGSAEFCGSAEVASQRSGLNVIESRPQVRELVLTDSHEIEIIFKENISRPKITNCCILFGLPDLCARVSS